MVGVGANAWNAPSKRGVHDREAFAGAFAEHLPMHIELGSPSELDVRP
ncbi:MAG: hypothetical protein U0174_27370 [Polyangiaceae bacterium]